MKRDDKILMCFFTCMLIILTAVIAVGYHRDDWRARCLNSAVKAELCDVDMLGDALYQDMLHWHNAYIH
jgi:hypothetical protein